MKRRGGFFSKNFGRLSYYLGIFVAACLYSFVGNAMSVATALPKPERQFQLATAVRAGDKKVFDSMTYKEKDSLCLIHDATGNNLLHTAVRYGRTEIMWNLLVGDIELVDKKNHDGLRPIDLALKLILITRDEVKRNKYLSIIEDLAAANRIFDKYFKGITH